MWPYLLDPELLALVVLIGVQHTRLEIGVLGLQARSWWTHGRRGVDSGDDRSSEQ
jgi:hypothetical protein